MNSKKNKKNQGFTIIEIMVVVVVVVSVFGTILSFLSLDIRSGERNRVKIQAALMIREAMEAVRSFRDNTNWSENGIGTLVAGINYYPVIVSSGWEINPGTEALGVFTRSIVFYNVSRDTNDNIENFYNPTGNDPNTKRVEVLVGWSDRYGQTSESVKTYITNWRE